MRLKGVVICEVLRTVPDRGGFLVVVVVVWPCVVHQSDCEDMSSLSLCAHSSSAKASWELKGPKMVSSKQWILNIGNF